MVHANILGIPKTENTGLHHKFIKFLRFLDTPEVPTALTQEILEIEMIYDAGQYFLISESQNIGLHHKFLKENLRNLRN